MVERIGHLNFQLGWKRIALLCRVQVGQEWGHEEGHYVGHDVGHEIGHEVGQEVGLGRTERYGDYESVQ